MSSKEDVERYEAAREALAAHREPRNAKEESDEYLRLNQAVIDAEKNVPWWKKF